MNISALRDILKSRWKFIWHGWTYRYDIELLCASYESLSKVKDRLHSAEMEIEDLKRRLEAELAEHHRSKGHVQKMWNFIALRHRVDLPMQEGSIRKILQDSQTT